MFIRTYSTPARPGPRELWQSNPGCGARFGVPASTVLADTGALNSGWYIVELIMSFDMDTPAANKALVCQLRDNSNTLTISELSRCEVGQALEHRDSRFFIAQDERLRIVSLSVPGSPESRALWQLRAVALPD